MRIRTTIGPSTASRRIKRLAGAVGMSAAIAGGMLAVATPASAASCGTVWDVYISGGESHYTVDCFGTTYRVSGYVKDTRADGKCAQVKAVFGSGTQYSPRACPKGTSRNFDLSGTRGVNVYTFLS